ncbi:MAG: hypothetical protein LBU85_09085 [Treponema sp.]|nr:hypothetical protein [Treponema sp.]
MMKRLLEYESDTVLPPEIKQYFDYFDEWIRECRYDPDKMFIGLGDLRSKIMYWFIERGRLQSEK